LEIRERLAFPPFILDRALLDIHRLPEVREDLIISTCNRVEVIFVSARPAEAIEQVKEFLRKFHHLSQEELEKYFFIYSQQEAVAHLFRVASSLDSMVVGESQILGQVKEGYRAATHNRCCGLVLSRFLHKAFSVAKRVRTETSLGNLAVSVSSVAVELAKKIFGELKGKSVLLLGAGDMAELAAAYFIRQGIKELIVANRTYERGKELAIKFEGVAVEFEHFPHYLNEVDIVLSSTGSMEFIIKKERIDKVIKARKNRPIFLIDIAVPRDIDPMVNEVANVYLYDIDDLSSVAGGNLEERQHQAQSAEDIVAEETATFSAWLKSLEVTPTVVSLIQKLRTIRDEELSRSISRFSGLPPEDRKTLERLTRRLVNKILHEPITRLKRNAADPDGLAMVEAVRKLFGLDEE
jgi:glutamyl-tRNA reductase